MDAYSILLRDRRITDYVMEQAYLWLYEQIVKDSYVAGDRQSEKLILEIKQAGAVTQTSYEAFLQAFMNDPYQYLLVSGDRKNQAGIVSPNLKNYFLRFNEQIIPVGFVEEFFEDDYETLAEVRAYYDAYLGFNIDQFSLNCQAISLSRKESLDNIQKAYPGIFKTKFKFHFTNALRFVLTFVGLYLCLMFFSAMDPAARVDEVLKFGYSAFLEAHAAEVVANIVFLVYLVFKLVKCIKIVIFYVHWFQVRLKIQFLDKSFDALDGETIAAFREYFKAMNRELSATRYVITDDMCRQAPPRRQHYVKLVNFNAEGLTKSLTAMVLNKSHKSLCFYYANDRDLAICKRAWRKGIVLSVLLIVVFAVMNVPEWNLSFQLFWEVLMNDGIGAAFSAVFGG